MKTFIKILFFVFLTNLVKPQWELRYNSDFIRKLASDGNKLYMGRNNGMTAYDFATKEGVNLTSLNSELPGNYINTLMPLNDNTILISTNGGLALIENGVITNDKPICSSYPDTDARDLYIDSSGSIWTFSSHKVHKYSDGVWKSYDISDSITYRFDLASLFFHKDQCWALFNDNTKTETVYYYSDVSDEYLKIAVIDDTGIIKTFQSKEEFPYRQGSVSFISAADDVYLKNGDGIYQYRNNIWSKTNIFLDSPFEPFWLSDLLLDNNNNLWTIVRDELANTAHPASYNLNTSIMTHHLSTEDEKYIASMIILNDGTIIAYTRFNLHFYNDTGWTRKKSTDLGIPDSVYFTYPVLVNGKIYSVISYSPKKDTNIIVGTTICLDDGSQILPITKGFPYSTITQFGINKDGKGMFLGKFSYIETYQYEAESGFVRPDLVSNVIDIKPCLDGYVYYTSQRLSGPSGSTPFLTTWDGDELIKRDMGFIEKNPEIIDFDVKDNYLVALGRYEYDYDSLTTNYSSYISIYNTSEGTLLNYDRNNSPLPDFYYIIDGYFRYGMDTIPSKVTVDNDMNVWIKTNLSLIKFNPSDSKVYDIPVYDSVKNYHISLKQFNFDSKSNELVGLYVDFRNTIHTMFFYFDIATEKWDSIPKADAGFIGNYVTHKKLLDNNVWACDDLGYMYRYAGKGHFTPYNLQVNGKPNLGFFINDFSIDANNYLHLGTDIGLLTNKTILTGVEENTIIEVANISIYPNPATDFIQLHYSDNVKFSDVEIYNVLGIKVLVTDYKDRIDVSGLNAGVYFLKTGGKIYKFVKM
ncbi:MAG: T9SS type A sorting domain-containing protein [Ignavibacteriae bacterium]|nr:T9SS type A sorting domain-containing protein [Ignavibacteriota bacterium]